MRDHEQRLVDLAGAISDGHQVDWGRQEFPELSGPIAGLRTLSEVAEAFGATQRPLEAPGEVLFRWGPLEVLEKLGEGQFGGVWKAWDPQLQRDVALKLSNGSEPLVRTWLSEAQRLASVRHPHVLTVFGAAVYEGRAGIWTDLLTGRTLEERLVSEGPLGVGELRVVGTELCRALAAVHGADLTHGDIKTENVVRDQTGKLVLVDFGAARPVEDGPDLAPQGTPAYLAPELAAGSPPSPASDLYALGALLYRVATGCSWAGGEAKSMRDARPDFPTELVATIEGLLAKKPSDRPASASAVERRLVAGLEGPAAPKPLWRRPGLYLAALTTVVLLGLLIRSTDRGLPGPASPLDLPFEASLWGERSDSEIRLVHGAPIRPGDRLVLKMHVEEPMHVYVFNEDDVGNLFVLFPLPGLAPTNPLNAGDHRLPGAIDGEPQSWEVTSVGGKERFLIVGSRVPLPELDRLKERSDRARRGRQVEAPDTGVGGETLRGVGGLGASTPSQSSLLGQLHAELSEDSEGSVWAELLVLDNPR